MTPYAPMKAVLLSGPFSDPAWLLRHPRYLGLRADKPAREVVRELPSG